MFLSRRFAFRQPKSPRRSRGFKPAIEMLEDRWAPAVITVTTAADELFPNDGTVSLREAITAVNLGTNLGDPDIIAQTPGTFGTNDTIKFNIPGAGVHTIHLQSALPTIVKPVDIQGYTQPGATPNTLTVGDNAQLMIEIDGTGAATGSAFFIDAAHVSVSGLILNRASGEAIRIDSSDGTHIWGNFIGTDATGSVALANSDGVDLGNFAKNTLIGGATPAERNVISGNTNIGILLNSNPANLATGTMIEGNYIGTDHSGLVALGNYTGVTVQVGQTTTIGGTAAGQGNLISGNQHDGIFFPNLFGQSNSALIVGNLIGTDATGTKALANGGVGVHIQNPGFITVGEPGAGNVVSGNAGVGIELDSPAANDVVDSNYVGTTADGTAALGNAGVGIEVNATSNATIQNNIVAANLTGIQLANAGTAQVMRNFVGTNAKGTAALGNLGDGIDVTASPGLVIGGSGTGNRNVVSGNGGTGIFVASDGVLVLGNFVGTDVTGTVALGNQQFGVRVQGNSNTVVNNQISGNAQGGILLDGNGAGNQIRGNRIGTDASGLNGIGNGGAGVNIQQASNTVVGGTTPGAANTIAFNTDQGVFVQAGNHNHITGNAIFGNGGLGIDLNVAAALPAGGNDKQPGPFVTSAVLANNGVTISGSLGASVNTSYDIECFANTSLGGASEGRIYLGTATVMTDGSGEGTFTAQFPLPAVKIQSVTATATAPNGDTSQFSNEGLALPPAFTYNQATKVLTISGTTFLFTQTTTANGATLHTTYTFTMDGQAVTLPDTLLAGVVVNGLSPYNTATLITNDTYVGPGGVTHETTEAITIGDFGGKVQKLDAQNVAHDFLSLSNFQVACAIAGPADEGFITCTPGVKNVFVGGGGYAYMNTGDKAQDFYYIKGAKSVYSYAVNPTDFAYQYDGSGPSTYVVSGTAYSYETGTDAGKSFFNEAVGFKFNYGIAQHPSQDVAYFYDSPKNDIFVGNTTNSYMYSSPDGMTLAESDYALGFTQVYAESFVGGTDYAYVYDTTVNHVTGFHRLA
jgi:CSLREA domain-containing protein